MPSSRRPSAWWRATSVASISGRRGRGFTSDESALNQRPMDSCRRFAGVGVTEETAQVQRCSFLQQRFQDMCYTVLEPLSWNRLEMHMSNQKQAMPVVQEETLLYQRNEQPF